jgi:glycosyltransferase 2 family protein
MGARLSKTGSPFPLRRAVRWAGMLLSSGLFIWLLARQDWGSLSRYLLKIPWWVIPLVLLLYYSGMVINALRWYILLRAQKVEISFLAIVKIVFAGAFVSNFLPSTIGGDAVRVVGVQQIIGNWAISTASIVVDRLLNVLAMVASSPFSLMTFGSSLFHLFGAGASATPAVAGIVPARFSDWRKMGQRLWQPVKSALSMWWNQPVTLVIAFIAAWFSVFVVFVAVWWLARLLGIQVTLYQVIGINVITYLLTLIPISFNGYGVREFAMVSLYLQIGASVEQASMLALITRSFMLVETLPGVLWLSRIMPEVSKKAKSDAPQEDGE